MLVTLLGIVTLVRLVQPENASVPDAGDAVGDRDAGQAGAAVERPVPDAGDAVGDRVASGYAPRVLDERGLALVEQDSIHIAIDGIARIHRDCRQAGAVIERLLPMLVTLLGIVTLVRPVQS